MRKVRRTALVPHSAKEMFDLVDDVEAYPEFLPWCNDASVQSRDENTVVATLELHKGTISKHFTTRNTLKPHDAIDMTLIDGPFRHLDGGWRFRDITDDGCEVSLELEFEFDSRIVDMMFGRFFEDTLKALVDAFTRRAAAVYG
ncbi:MAG TPA: type II toxin-antitoxin system RatA family toxin [Woeseiaceae bacterium]|nr:type II toxin-antitoxin system RatA family toxin [Woeseiaceae bacterium]